MRDLQGGKGIGRENEGESGVKSEKLGNGDMDNQGDDGGNFYEDGEGTKRENLENYAEVGSEKSKKGKKSKIEGKCSRDEVKTNTNKKRKLKACSDMTESDVENGVQGNEMSDEREFCERDKTKTKKSKKRTKESPEATRNSVENITKENHKIWCSDDAASSAKGRSKVKTKKGKKERKIDVENIPDVVETGVDSEQGRQNRESSSFGKEDKVVKRKKSKKRKLESLDGSEMMVVKDKEDERNLDEEEQSVCFKQDGVKRKKNKKKTKRDK